ncbi:hypothetical protein ACMDMS_20260, partial [Acinetobacter baumannii]
GVFFFQAEAGIRDLVRSRGLGDVYKGKVFEPCTVLLLGNEKEFAQSLLICIFLLKSDAADDLPC